MSNPNRQAYTPRRAAEMRAKKAKERKIRRIITCSIILLLVVLLIFISFKFFQSKKPATPVSNHHFGTSQENNSDSTSDETGNPTKEVASAEILSTGDILIHKMILDNSKMDSGEYVFTQHFEKLKDKVQAADYSVVNLEVTLGGKDRGYSCYPCFSSPDSIVDALKYAGFNFIITANNHSYDTGFDGLKRTVNTVRSKGFEQTGTRSDLSQKKYAIVEVNGIKLGIVNYASETNTDEPGRKAINGILLAKEANDYINSFSERNLSAFYSEMENNIKDMKKDGAEAIILYIHWGLEYHTTESPLQDEIAQKMCDLGIDAIIGDHPHVIQPATTLTSKTTGKKTFCIYSVGNCLSNQRIEYMDGSCTTGHTEDGILVYTTFTKYEDGHVELTKVDYIPTWVNRFEKNGRLIYEITPLDNMDNITINRANAEKSKARTVEIVDAGFKSFNNN